MRKRTFFNIGLFLLLLGMVPLAYSATSLKQRARSYRRLEKELRPLIDKSSEDVGLIVRDLAFPGSQIRHQSDKKFVAASMVKLPILAVLCQAVKEKRFSFQTVLVVEPKDLTGGSGELKRMKLPVKASVAKLAELMIVHSDNTAANKLIDLLGMDYLNRGFEQLGFKHTVLRRKMMDFALRKKGIENYTSAEDMAYALEMIYRGKLVDEESSERMLSFLKKQKLRDRIPKYLPKSVCVAHKTGLERGVVHDAGIVFLPKGDFIICVLTSQAASYKKAKKLIAELSLLAYDSYQ